MPGNFNPDNPKVSWEIGTERKQWIHDRANASNPKLTDTQYICKLIDTFREVIESE